MSKLRDYVISEILEDIEDYLDSYGCDLHYDLYNFEDKFGFFRESDAKEFVIEYLDDIIDCMHYSITHGEFRPNWLLNYRDLSTFALQQVAFDVINDVAKVIEDKFQVDILNEKIGDHIDIFKETLTNIYSLYNDDGQAG